MRDDRAPLRLLGGACLILLLGVFAVSAPLSAAAPATPQRGGTLITVLGGDPPTLNPDVTHGVPEQLMGCAIYQSLVRVDLQYQVQPLLAKSWTISADGLHYRFQLVNARWQDGQPFTSADVQYTLTNVSAKYGPGFAAAGSDIASIDTPDAGTVVVNLKKPFGPLLLSLSCDNSAAILPAHLFKDTDVLTNPAALTKPVGTGPFQLGEWVRGDHLTLVRNPGYWHPGLPYLDRVVARIVPQPSSRTLALKSGNVDYIEEYFFPLSDYPTFAHDPNVAIYETSSPADQVLIFNVRRPMLNDRRVRQALFAAIDRDYLLRAVFDGLGNAGTSAIDSRMTWAYNPAVDYQKIYPYDPARAKQLLDEAGARPGAGGWRFTVRLTFDSTRSDYVSLAQAIQNYWQAVGVQVVLDGAERQVELNRVYQDWNFDATLQAYSTGGDPALGISRLYVTSAIQKRPFVNASGYSSTQVDILFAQGALNTTQPARARYYRQAQAVLARDLPTLVIEEEKEYDVASKRVHNGLWQGLAGYEYWDGVWLEH